MPELQPNLSLAEVMTRVNCSNKGLAARVRTVAARHGTELKCDHVTVKRWLDGSQPRTQTAGFIAEALSEKAGLRISVEDIGMGQASPMATFESALQYPEEIAGARVNLLELARHDSANLPNVIAAPAVPAAWSAPLLPWLLSRPDPVPETGSTARRVGMAEVEAICGTNKMFMQLDFQYGGGHARSALAQYFTAEVLPLLDGKFTESVGKRLFSAASEVAQLLGWTAYDAGRHGLAQRYLIQALRLAQAGQDRVMGSRILSNLSHQANYLGRFTEAAQLARAAQEGGKETASATVMTMLLSMEARALAGSGDEKACAAVLVGAETIFGRRKPSDDPPWIDYFDEAELAGEMAHCFRDLRKPKLAQEFVGKAVALSDPSYVRTLAFMRLVLCASCIHELDLERAAGAGIEAITLAGSLKSERYLRYIRDLCNDLAPHRSSAAVVRFLGLADEVLSPSEGSPAAARAGVA
ncbi:sporulation protein [Plantactinospora soyae]|uniref:Tetratricopeptide (TPR) repeat protein n=1 Tax=Plantactinospora soyae TaxID=1544732 RepID=A0A927LZF6_9ACTN|nr:sporulation protein [Plantactinospora soyae]MBE1485214.1 tetratricopeptide (TPR) repeat protein [Plantactinospora soyae]